MPLGQQSIICPDKVTVRKIMEKFYPGAYLCIMKTAGFHACVLTLSTQPQPQTPLELLLGQEEQRVGTKQPRTESIR